MRKKDDKAQKQPYMYIVQPNISPAHPNMQSQYQSIIEQESQVLMAEKVLQEEIRVISSEKVSELEQVNGAEEVDEIKQAIKEKVSRKAQVGRGEVVEISTSVQMEEIDEEEQRSINQRMKKQQLRPKQLKDFSKMSKEELLLFLVRIPASTPKPVCRIRIHGEEVIGQVHKKKGSLYTIKVIVNDHKEQILVTIDQIEAIGVESV
ncbi:MAG: CotO family spore coat protein [Bacillus sp. (in: firmicutes)]